MEDFMHELVMLCIRYDATLQSTRRCSSIYGHIGERRFELLEVDDEKLRVALHDENYNKYTLELDRATEVSSGKKKS